MEWSRPAHLAEHHALRIADPQRHRLHQGAVDVYASLRHLFGFTHLGAKHITAAEKVQQFELFDPGIRYDLDRPPGFSACRSAIQAARQRTPLPETSE